MKYVDVDIAGCLATVKLNRAEARNALCIQMMEELRDTARNLQTNTDVHAVILCADGAEGSEEMSFVVVYVGGSRRI